MPLYTQKLIQSKGNQVPSRGFNDEEGPTRSTASRNRISPPEIRTLRSLPNAPSLKYNTSHFVPVNYPVLMPLSTASTSTLTLTTTTTTSSSILDNSRGTRCYEFARGFIQNTITILDDLNQPIYTLSAPCPSQQQSPTKPISLQDAHTHKELATIHPRTVLPDFVSIYPRIGPAKPQTVFASRLLRKYILEDSSPTLILDIPASANLGLSSDEKLFWRVSPDGCFMTLYSAINWRQDSWISLGTAYFSLSSSVKRLIALEVEDGISEALLIYILISIPMVEHKLHKEDVKRARSQDSKPTAWAMPALGFYYMFLGLTYI